MKPQGSVLIVVLGLLAILAVVGVTFVTMSSVDRATASNFALQSQFMLAADGAVDYVCHHLVQDLWEFDPVKKEYKTPTNGTVPPLLSDGNKSATATQIIRNEPWDSAGIWDPWLSPTIHQLTSAPTDGTFPYSYKNAICDSATYAPFGLKAWGKCTSLNPANDYTIRANNLGIPGGDTDDPRSIDPFRPANGVWIPDLSSPFETGVIRVSVTVMDHNALVNLNAHGNTTDPELGDLKGLGYLPNDVDPQAAGFDPIRLLEDPNLGLWRGTNPGNRNLLQAVLENPGKYGDKPFTLDEEFELRRLRGTPFKSRLEQLGSNIMINDPKTDMDLTKVANRLKVTTVSWTSEVRRNKREIATPILPNEATWSRKADVNLDQPGYIYQSMVAAGACPANTDAFKQFAANIAGFRDGNKRVGIKAFAGGGFETGDSKTYYSASRQPLFTKASATSTPVGSDTRWDVKLEVSNPWPDDVAGLAGGLTVSGMDITCVGGGSLSPTWASTSATPWKDTDASRVFTLSVTCTPGQDLSTRIISLTGPGVNLDQITTEELTKLKTSGTTISRAIYVDYEVRGTKDPHDATRPAHQPVLYVGAWKSELVGTWGGRIDWSNTGFTKAQTSGIAIRFPRSVPVNEENTGPHKANFPERGLPPRATSWSPRYYRAIARLGDLDQVLCPLPKDPATGLAFDPAKYWPWIVNVAKATSISGNHPDRQHKFDWWPVTWKQPGEVSPPDKDTYAGRQLAANCLTVGGPWLDKIDNDGDGYLDEVVWTGFQYPVAGKAQDRDCLGLNPELGLFGGPELRVAGLVNLNTAHNATLDAIGQGVNIPGFKDKINTLRVASAPDYVPTGQPLMATASVIKALTPGGEADPVEVRDENFAKISNFCTIRSDTFSIYGTVQYIDAYQMRIAQDKGYTGDKVRQTVRRSRRFWALVDRSPTCAFAPTDHQFIHPRIMNFQWLD